MDPAIDIRDLSYTYAHSSRPALEHVSLRVPEGSVMAILGPSEAGKTTLLFAIAGLLGIHGTGASSSGSVAVLGHAFTPFPSHPEFPHVSMLLQDPAVQISGLTDTVQEEILLGLRHAGVARENAEHHLEESLRLLGIPHLRDRTLRSLSGGEIQKVALASAIATGPSVLLLDEPASALDPASAIALASLLRRLAHRSTIMFTDTTLDLAVRCADTVCVFDAGGVRFTGSPADLIRSGSLYCDMLPTEPWTTALRRLERAPAGDPLVRRLRRLAGMT